MTTKQITYPFILALLLLSIEINGPDVGLPAFITGKRVGILLLTGVLLLQRSKRQPMPAAIQWAIFTLCFVTVWANLSCLFSDSIDLGFWVGIVVAWGLLGYCVYGMWHILPRILAEEKQLFIQMMVGMGFLVNLLTVLWLVRSNGIDVFFSPYTLRHALNDYLVCGMNRYLNGMFFWNMFPIAVCLGVLRTNLPIYALSMAGSAGFFVMCLLTASRQTTTSIVLYAFVLIIALSSLKHPKSSRVQRRSRFGWFRVAVGVGVLSGILYVILSSENVRSTLYRTMVQKTETQYGTESQGRITVARDSWKNSFRYPIFGVGDFVQSEANTMGRATHNGYVGLLANSGFPPLIAVVALLTGSLRWGLSSRRQAQENEDLWCVSYSFLIVYLAWSVNFNDILREHMLFFTLALMVYSISSATVRE